jgi:hypothetical protein
MIERKDLARSAVPQRRRGAALNDAGARRFFKEPALEIEFLPNGALEGVLYAILSFFWGCVSIR